MAVLRVLLWICAAGALGGIALIGVGMLRRRRQVAVAGLAAAVASCLAFIAVALLILARLRGHG